MRAMDVEALRRLRDHGPLTIPEAYDCGYERGGGEGHGMHRLTSAGYAVYVDWDTDVNDCRWQITTRGRAALMVADPNPV